MSLLTDSHLEEFTKDGICVIENVLTPKELAKARAGLHRQLLGMGINHDAIIRGEEKMAEEDGGRLKSPVSRIFYAKWKMAVHMNERVFRTAEDLVLKTYGTEEASKGKGLWAHPFGSFDQCYASIDRVCWRLPDQIRKEGGLGVHLDRDPVDPYLEECGGLKKWRPIQAFVALTDHYTSESGGLKVVRGFHSTINDYFENQKSEGGGEFYRMDPKIHARVCRECEFVYVPAGSLVLWDNRLPHATTAKQTMDDAREVVYTGFSPAIELNKKYIADQWQCIVDNVAPNLYQGRSVKITEAQTVEHQVGGKKIRMEVVDRDYPVDDLPARIADILGKNL